jgi:ElaB/YqjD/DUF883 family membrane-anchored ribosome-binding protein
MVPTYRRLRRKASDTKDTIADALERQARAARRAARRAAFAAQDRRDRTAMLVRRAPFRSLGVAFAAGAVTGIVTGAIVARIVACTDTVPGGEA